MENRNALGHSSRCHLYMDDVISGLWMLSCRDERAREMYRQRKSKIERENEKSSKHLAQLSQKHRSSLEFFTRRSTCLVLLSGMSHILWISAHSNPSSSSSSSREREKLQENHDTVMTSRISSGLHH